MSPSFLFCLVFLLLPGLRSAAAEELPHARAELLVENTDVENSATLRAALHFTIDREWHIYWRNPGDSGERVRAKWDLPEGWAAQSMDWPAPRRIPVGPLMNYGYADEVTFPITLVAGGTSAMDGIRATVTWLVCQDICVPGKAVLPLKKDPRALGLLATAAEHLPRSLPSGWQTRVSVDSKRFELLIDDDGALSPDAFFFPWHRNELENAARQTVERTGKRLRLLLPRSEQLEKAPDRLEGTLVAGDLAYDLSVPFLVGNAGAGMLVLFQSVLFAFLGGIVLNAMPCVFPVLSIKAVSLLRHSGSDFAAVRAGGWLYSAGVIVSFWALAGALLALRAGGEKLGWGFQLQSPVFVAFLAALLFLLALSLLGVFEIGASWAGVGSELAGAEGAGGAFFSGVLATVVATPCTAPFMGTALGFAASQPPMVAFVVFTALGAGLAAPYLVLCHTPMLGRMLPRPGRWMETFKQVMAFPLLATVIWLVWVLSLQTGSTGAAVVLGGLLTAGFGAWILGRWSAGVLSWIGRAAILLGFLTGTLGVRQGAPEREVGAEGIWQTYSMARVQSLLAEGKPVFIDFTASWCVTCKVNEITALGAGTLAKFRQHGVTLLRADWTNGDPEITRALASFGRNGVPLYVLYTGERDASPVILPQLLTSGIVLREIDKLKEAKP